VKKINRVRSSIPGNGHGLSRLCFFPTVHSRCSPGDATVCPGKPRLILNSATVPNRSLIGKSRGYIGSSPWHAVTKLEVTVSPPWTQLIPVLLRFHPVVLRCTNDFLHRG